METPPSTPRRKRAAPASESRATDYDVTDGAAGRESPRSAATARFTSLSLRDQAEVNIHDIDLERLDTPTVSPRKRNRQQVQSTTESHGSDGTTLQLMPEGQPMSSQLEGFGRVHQRMLDGIASTASNASVEPKGLHERTNESHVETIGTSDSPGKDLTWRDSEITGHLMDNPEDDGVGMNGIGFKPTPAMAQARSLKRQHQIAEWKARETREARQRRGERRWRGTVSSRGSQEETAQRRAVHFS